MGLDDVSDVDDVANCGLLSICYVDLIEWQFFENLDLNMFLVFQIRDTVSFGLPDKDFHYVFWFSEMLLLVLEARRH